MTRQRANVNQTMTVTIITRKQLRGLGLSHYLAREITRNLTPVQKQAQAFCYSIQDVVMSMKEHSNKIRVKPQTRRILDVASTQLLLVTGNRIPVAFGTAPDSELSQLVKQALRQMRKTDRTLASLKLDAAEIQTELTSNDLH